MSNVFTISSRATWTWSKKLNNPPPNGFVHEGVKRNIFNGLPQHVQSISTVYELDGVHHTHTLTTHCQNTTGQHRPSNRTELYADVVQLDGKQLESIGFRFLPEYAFHLPQHNIAVGRDAAGTTGMSDWSSAPSPDDLKCIRLSKFKFSPYDMQSYLNNPETVCETAARLLFMFVTWVRSIPAFTSLDLKDQLALLEDGWKENFILLASQFQMNFEISSILSNAGMW